MDYDETANISAFDSNDEIPYSVSREKLPQEIIFAVCGLVALWADIAIIYTIFRFKRMRRAPNMFMVNWAIADVLCLMVTPSAYRIFSVVSHLSLSHEFLCVLVEYGIALHITVLAFVILVVVDWFIAAHFGGASDKLRSNYKLVLGAIWLFAIMWSNIFTGICMSESRTLIHQPTVLVISYLAVLLIVIVCQISRVVQKCRRRSITYSSVMLSLATAFIFNSFLSIVCIFLTMVIHHVFAIISVCLMFSSSICNLTLLYFLDKDFQACFLQVFRRSGSTYEESIEEFENPISNANTEVAVKVLFDNDAELLENEH